MKEFSLYKTIFYGSIFAFILFLVFQIDFENGIDWHGIETFLKEPFVAKNWHYLLLIWFIWCINKEQS